MMDEMKAEAVDMCVTAVEKHPGNYEVRISYIFKCKLNAFINSSN